MRNARLCAVSELTQNESNVGEPSGGMCRIIELSGGSIVLDGIDIASIGLRDLRSNLSFVAQDPVLFSGTVRSNLDPLATCSDATLGTALQQAGLEEWVSNLEVCYSAYICFLNMLLEFRLS